MADVTDEATSRDDLGHGADAPTEIPRAGWLAVARRVATELKRDNAPLLAGGVAFFALLALVPALVALVSIYGLVADPADIQRHLDTLSTNLPTEVHDLLERQLVRVSESSSQGLGVALVLGLTVALWSASSGVAQLVSAISTVYDEDESRGFVALRGLAIVLTLGAIVFLVVTFTAVALLPTIVEATGMGEVGQVVVTVLRWPLLAAAMVTALSVLYRWAPDRASARWRWTSPGAVAGTAIWLLASGLFSLYASSLGSFQETYGSLASVVVLMLWLFVSALAVLVGAELNSELERHTVRDTTAGEDAPMGRRGAVVSDQLPPPTTSA